MNKSEIEIESLKAELRSMKSKMDVLKIVLDESTDPIFNILEDGTYRYINNAFSNPFNMKPEDIIGKRIWDIFSPEEAEKRMTVVKKAFSTGETIVFDVRVPTVSGDIFFITSVKPVKDENGTVTSVVCISKNITERKKGDEQREKLITDLQEAMSKIRTLSGMLPICSSCKKIRNDQGYWTQIELYIRDHSDAEFSHGICPDCCSKLYPDLDK
ncbi:MAG TPA: PAS domain-containing protein [Spirochaetota bacterium]|nr:PAS domain-containing protein [Spirochaetota bacterium]HPS87165.1 PAS domain-containing protein [Spirochaetota bacterium]